MENSLQGKKEFNRSEYMKELWRQGTYERHRSVASKAKMSNTMKSKREKGELLMPAERYEETKDPKLKHVAKGPEYHLSKYWKISSPAGKIIEGFNLSDIVRKHVHLFDPNDTKPSNPRGNQCRAVTCIAQLKYLNENGTPRRTQWKGWRLLLLKDVITGEIQFSA